ncbi:MAG: cell division protein FtsX [Rhodospirillaceae bacterium]
MIDLRSDLPHGGDSAAAYIPWLVAIMVFLGILAISGAGAFDSILKGWARSVTGTLTIQIPPNIADQNADVARIELEKVLATLRTLPSVELVNVLSDSDLDRLLAPWLGEEISSSGIPMPTLLDVTLTEDAPQTLDNLRLKIEEVLPGAVIDDHRRWFEHLVALAEGFRILALCVAIVVTSALSLTVIYATRASLAEFRDIIEVFHFIGARDGYVAGQFAKRTFLAAIKGSLWGLVTGGIALFAIGWLANNVKSGLLPEVALDITFWLTLPMTGVIAATLAMVTAYLTVIGTLRNMM